MMNRWLRTLVSVAITFTVVGLFMRPLVDTHQEAVYAVCGWHMKNLDGSFTMLLASFKRNRTKVTIPLDSELVNGPECQ